jgi:hypothetical protein
VASLSLTPGAETVTFGHSAFPARGAVSPGDFPRSGFLMNDLIQRIVNAIIRQEGMPAEYFNPGNLRAAPWLSRITIVGGFWNPVSRGQGIAGAAHVVALHIAEGNSLCQLIGIWAPPSDGNNTLAYIANVKEWAAIPDENAPLYTFLV